MSQAAKLKASERQKLCSQLMTVLKKDYKVKPPMPAATVVEDLLYAICLHNAPQDQADAAYEQAMNAFFDLNEMRVSSISEIAKSLGNLPDAENKAMMIKDVLHRVYELEYSFEWESLRKAKIEQVESTLSKVPSLTPFIINYCMMTSLSNHAAPMDDLMTTAAIWFGLIPPNTSPSDACDQFKSAMKKADCPLFMTLWHALSTDPKHQAIFETPLSDDVDPGRAPAMLKDVLAGKIKPGKPKAPAAKAPPAKKPKAAKTTQSAPKKTSTKKSTTKKTDPQTTAKKKSTKKKSG